MTSATLEKSKQEKAARGELPRVDAKTLSKEQFWNEFVRKRRPCVLTNMKSLSGLAGKWTEKYLEATIGSYVIPVTHSLGDRSYFRDDSAQVQKITFGEFLKHQREKPLTKQYILIKNFNEILPRLSADVQTPDLIADQRLFSQNFWYGTCANRTELHFDLGDNLLAVIRGVKRVELFSPASGVRPYHWSSPQPANFSPMDRADRFSSSKLTHKAIETTLNAGEVLYLPTGWWHRIDSDPGIALNFWWSPGWWPLVRSTLSGRALRGFMLHIVWRALRLTRKRKPTETLLNAQVSFEGRSAQAKITSLSLSGCAMLADVPLSKGSTVELKAMLPFPHSDAVEFSMKGVVRNVSPESIKVDFDTMQPKDCHQLLEFLEASRPPEQRWGAVRLAQ